MSNQGGFSEEAFEKYQRLLSEKEGVEFSEGETYDFTRCMRPDGSFYGTRGRCKKGSETGAKEVEAPKTVGGKKRRATAEGKAAGAAERKAAGGAKRSEHARRARLFQDELKKVRNDMAGADDAKRNRLIQEANDRANKRHAAGDDAGKKAEAKEDREGKAAAAKASRTVDQLSPSEKAARAARQAAAKPKAGSMLTASDSKRRQMVADAKGRQQARDAEAKPKRKLATSQEARAAWQEAEKALKAAKAEYALVKAATKGDKSPESARRRLNAGIALDKAERAAFKASDKFGAAMKRESRKAMTPEQRKEEREWNKFKKQYG
jgi:hypothetical protein